MKALIFNDVHGSSRHIDEICKKARSDKPDLIICLGDLTIFGRDQKNILKRIDSLGIQTLMLHGNHEAAAELEKDCKKTMNIRFIHNKTLRFGRVLFMGWGGGGFSLVDDKFNNMIERFREERRKDDTVVLLTHGPPYGTALDMLDGGEHCGCKTYMQFIKRFRPNYAFCGHIHECNGKRQAVDSTTIVNPGPEGNIIEV